MMSVRESTHSGAVLLIAVILIAIGFVATRDLMVPATERWFPMLRFFPPYTLAPGALMLWYVLSRGASKWTIRNLLLGSIVGFVGGLMFFPGISAFTDLAKRWLWARSGGGGESAEWGEPLFYIMTGGIPAGLLGAVLGMSLVAAILRARASASGGQKLDDDKGA